MDKYKSYDKFSITNNIYKTYHVVSSKSNKNNEINKKKLDILTIANKNKFLWCIYYILNDDFENYNDNPVKIEYTFKLKMIDLIEKNPDLLKTIKLQKYDVQHDLFHSKEIDIFTLHALCIYNNISLLYVEGKKYYRLGFNEPKHIILKDNCNFGVYIDASPIKIGYYTNNYYYVENIKKPIKSISGYSYEDIKNICIQINVPIMEEGKKKTKKDLYQELLKIIS